MHSAAGYTFVCWLPLQVVFLAAFFGVSVCLCVRVFTACSRRLLAALSDVSFCLCFRLLAESRSRLSAASSGVMSCSSFRMLAACFCCLVWLLGLPLCLCTDCVFKVGRVSITSINRLLWGLELLTLSHVSCVLKACFDCLVWLLGLPLCPCTDCVFKVGRVSFTSVSRLLLGLELPKLQCFMIFVVGMHFLMRLKV